MPTHLRIVALVTTLIFSVVVFGRILVVQANPTSIVPSLGASAVTIPTVESDHPYENSADKFWTIANTGGQSAARIHFSRIDLESGVDKIEIRDAENTLIQEITTSSPDGLWSDTVPGASIRVTLKTDRSGQYWGFGIDQLEPVAYTTLGYSPHPYLNGSTAVKTLVNNTPSPAGTRVRFDRIELEDGVDYIVIKDLNDNPYQWITGSHPNGLISKAVPGSGIKVQLLSDGSGRSWGYNVAEIQDAAAEVSDQPPQWTTIAESAHPYTSGIQREWVITNSESTAQSSKVHFSRIGLGIGGNTLQLLDSTDTVIQTFSEQTQLTDVWSDYVPGRIVKLKLIVNSDWPDWGFRVDTIVNSIPNPGLAQSNHSYTSGLQREWTITNSDISAFSSKVHFTRIALGIGGNTLQMLDGNDTVIQTFSEQTQLTDVWSDYVPGRIVKLKLIVNSDWPDWGFRVDTIVNSIPNPGLAQSNHPYTSGSQREWTIVNPNVNASSSRVHFTRIGLGIGGNTLQMLDGNGTVIQTFSERTQLTDVWSDYVPGRIVKLKLIVNSDWPDWGFRVDTIEPSSAQNPPPAGLNALLVQVNAPGDIFLNGTKLFSVSYAGEYRVPLTSGVGVIGGALAGADLSAATAGVYAIRIDYITGYSQTIQATIGADGGIKVVYLPLVKK